MRCKKCNSEVVENAWGDWCDYCGGVIVGTKLFFRHVATVEGKGGRYPIVYDLSAETYGVAWPKKVVFVKCVYCGMQTPGDDPRDGLTRLDDLRVSYYSKRGSLDAMLAFIEPVARGESVELPELSAAPSSTPEERKLILG